MLYGYGAPLRAITDHSPGRMRTTDRVQLFEPGDAGRMPKAWLCGERRRSPEVITEPRKLGRGSGRKINDRHSRFEHVRRFGA